MRPRPLTDREQELAKAMSDAARAKFDKLHYTWEEMLTAAFAVLVDVIHNYPDSREAVESIRRSLDATFPIDGETH